MTYKSKAIDVETGNPVSFASVSLQLKSKDTGIGVVADAGGNFTIDSPLIGTPGYALNVTAVGYNNSIINNWNDKEVYLSKKGSLLAPVIVFAKSAGNNWKKILLSAVLIATLIYLSKKL